MQHDESYWDTFTLHKPLGKPKGVKDSELGKANKSESARHYLLVRNVDTGECARVKRYKGLLMVESGEYTHVCAGLTRKPLSDAHKAVLRSKSLALPRQYCVCCDMHIQGKQNWENHVNSKRHLEKAAYSKRFVDDVRPTAVDLWVDVN
jgi:hypothetical protein